MSLWKEQPNNYNDRKQAYKPVYLHQPTKSMTNKTPPKGGSSVLGKYKSDCIIIGNTSDDLKLKFAKYCNGLDPAIALNELLDIANKLR